MMKEHDIQQRLAAFIGRETEYWDFWGNIRKPWAAAKCFCLLINTMLLPAGVTKKQEESVMPLPMISCLHSSDVR